MRAALALLAFGGAAILAPAQDPELAEVRGRLPNGKAAMVRLQYKQGVSIESKDLPAAFLQKKGAAQWAPFSDLSPQGKRWALGALFPSDTWGRGEVRHKVRWPKVESVWLISALFTGHGQNYDKLMRLNTANPELLNEGDVWRIPIELLSPDFGGSATAPPTKAQPDDEHGEESRTAALRATLTFGKDSQGQYAGYSLRKGEALYSSIVMRFTDLVDAREVNELAAKIAKRSGIGDVRAIQPGQLIKIPLDCLAAPFQPEGSRALEESREMRAEVLRTAKIEAGPRLSGVRVVLDPGHGGIDSGARANGVWESDFVYDVAMRVKRLLELNTDAQVFSTLRYPGISAGIREHIPAMTTDAVLMTTPPKPNDGDSPNSISVNLRWVMANHFFAAKKGADIRKTIFISFHADSRHPSGKGTMVYVPASKMIPDKHSWNGGGASVAELKTGGKFNFTARQKRESEAQSLIFANGLLRELAKESLPVHENRPVRNVINRSGREIVPAVLRTNVATTKVLIEVVNLQNGEDAALLKNADYRELFAESVLRAIRAHYRK
jgi:N-acetylmuramoyl-L-alanine amidase